MRNSDFKALLTTPRPAGGQSQQQQGKDSGATFKQPRPKSSAAAGGDFDRDKKFKKPHPKRPGGKPGQAGDKQKEGEEGPLYRWVPLPFTPSVSLPQLDCHSWAMPPHCSAHTLKH